MSESSKDEIGRLVETLLTLTPASSEPVRIAQESKRGRNFSEMSNKYGDYFEGDNFDKVSEFFDMEMSGRKVSLDFNGLGDYLAELGREVEKKLDDDDYRESLSRWLGKEIPNPAREYTRQCLESIRKDKEEERLALKALKYITHHGKSYSRVKEKLAEEGISTDEGEIKDALLGISDLGIVKSVGEDEASVPEIYESHVHVLAEEYL